MINVGHAQAHPNYFEATFFMIFEPRLCYLAVTISYYKKHQEEQQQKRQEEQQAPEGTTTGMLGGATKETPEGATTETP